jgi:hypothetical protein
VVDEIPVAVRRQTQRTSCSGSGTEGSSTTLLADLHGHARASCQRERGVVPNNLPADENYSERLKDEGGKPSAARVLPRWNK